MKIVHPLLEEPILFEENRFPVWIVEDQTTFSALIAEIKQQISADQGLFVLSEGMDILSLHKCAELIVDPFALELNTKVILGKLYKRLGDTAVTEDYYLQTETLRTSLYGYLEELFASESLPLTYKDSFDIAHLLRDVEVRINCEEQCLAEMLPDYMRTATELGGIKLFILVNLKCFLSPEELTELYIYASYEKINLLLLENTYKKSYSDHERIILLDSDLCRLI